VHRVPLPPSSGSRFACKNDGLRLTPNSARVAKLEVDVADDPGHLPRKAARIEAPGYSSSSVYSPANYTVSSCSRHRSAFTPVTSSHSMSNASATMPSAWMYGDKWSASGSLRIPDDAHIRMSANPYRRVPSTRLGSAAGWSTAGCATFRHAEEAGVR
jgi:hypothetical protein